MTEPAKDKDNQLSKPSDKSCSTDVDTAHIVPTPETQEKGTLGVPDWLTSIMKKYS